MKKLTLIFPYYRNPMMLRAQMDIWNKYSGSIWGSSEIIVVDDGSPISSEKMACEVLGQYTLIRSDIRLFRILIDVPWNVGGARNLGAFSARGKWIMWVDMDHIVSPELADAILGSIDSEKLDESSIYQFHRVKYPTDEASSPHKETRLLTKETFLQTGGFDESFSGHYSFTERDFFDRIQSFPQVMFDGPPLKRYDVSQISDCTSPGLIRKDGRDSAAYEQIKKWKGSRGIEHLKFPWMEIPL